MGKLEGLFELGRVVATPGALAALDEAFGVLARTAGLNFLRRHVGGDWGNLSEEDAAANEHALRSGERIFSSYNLLPAQAEAEGCYPVRLWVITEWDRSYTTLLLPEDY